MPGRTNFRWRVAPSLKSRPSNRWKVCRSSRIPGASATAPFLESFALRKRIYSSQKPKFLPKFCEQGTENFAGCRHATGYTPHPLHTTNCVRAWRLSRFEYSQKRISIYRDASDYIERTSAGVWRATAIGSRYDIRKRPRAGIPAHRIRTSIQA